MRVFLLMLSIMFIGCKSQSQKTTVPDGQKATEIAEEQKERPKFIVNWQGEQVETIDKSAEQWKSELNEEAFYVLREAGTERSFTSPLLTNKKEGVYVCGGCDFPLFKSDTKYKSGTGWPSFYEPIGENHIIEDTDYKLGYARTEVRCARCNGHLGHVFNDGPKPTGLRYCINGVALGFEQEN